jgi:glycosyltransferase involved in cell wall biosynthesis
MLIVAGTGNDEQYLSLLKGLIDQHDLSDSVLLIGHVSLDEMIILYRNCNIFVTSTETEACPNIAIEAMSSGCNILSSDVLPLPEMFKESAIYYEHGNVGQLSAKMREMFAKEKGVNDRALSIIESFTWDKCADETYKLIIRELDDT